MQCIFYDKSSRILVGVEAEPSQGGHRPGRLIDRPAHGPASSSRSPTKLRTDNAGNFRLDTAAGTAADVSLLADLMLRALLDRYGARSDMKLTFDAPFAPVRPAACIPVS